MTKKDSTTKKDIIRQISESIDETQLKTKEIVQRTFEAIVDTLINKGRIELRNFGVFEVKRRKARKARNPRTGERVDVPPKNVVTFKPGKHMEELVSQMAALPDEDDEDAVTADVGHDSNGQEDQVEAPKAKKPRPARSLEPLKPSRSAQVSRRYNRYIPWNPHGYVRRGRRRSCRRLSQSRQPQRRRMGAVAARRARRPCSIGSGRCVCVGCYSWRRV